MNKRYWTGLVVLIVLIDAIATYWQNYQFPLDGDLIPTIFPAPWYSQVMHDPFGLSVLLHQKSYAGTNRFFAHASLTLYWKRMPQVLQAVGVSPISSLYAAGALFNTLIQLLLLGGLAAYVRLGTSSGERTGRTWWLAVALLLPLFQTAGFSEQMGITNQATTYTFFYAFPLGWVLVFFWPFYRAACGQKPIRLPAWRVALLVLLMPVMVFNGPICLASIAVILFCIGLHWAWHVGQRGLRAPGAFRWSMLTGPEWLSVQALALLATLGLLAAYSLYIGQFNAENAHTHTLKELYGLLPIGIQKELELQKGLQWLLWLLLLNGLLVFFLTSTSTTRTRVLHALGWVALFSGLFLLLLPFGGYRPYRPYLVRGDSILPILLGLLFAYGLSACFLLRELRLRVRIGYAVGVAWFSFAFMWADLPGPMDRNNACERWALEQLADATGPVVYVSPSCTVLGWEPFYDYHQTELQGKMLYYWGVTPKPVLYQKR